jgi:hypothetical protein
VKLISNYLREFVRGTWQGWNRFWFSPSDPATLGLIRIFAGAMLFYTHLIWSLDLNGFFGADGWLPAKTIESLPNHSVFEWSWFYWITSPTLMWTVHIASLVVFALLTIGLWSRAMSILAFLATVAYANRASLAQFGLDDANAMLAMYLMIGPCGAAYSVDSWLKRRRAGGNKLPVEPLIGANFAIRLLQVHLCVIYFFSGLGKAQGPLWWNGWAMLMATANYEYQSLSATWLIHYRYLAFFLTHLTVFWELSYCALVWPRLTRPIVIAIGVGMHLGIGLFLGMWTFGVAMIIANLAFVSPWVVRRIIDRGQTANADARTAAKPQAANSSRASRAAAQRAKPFNAANLALRRQGG